MLMQLREPYFKGVAGLYTVKNDKLEIAINVDAKGQFEWTPQNFPIGLFARFLPD